MYKAMPLPYSYDALEPVLSASTINIHYNRHYKKYLENLNNILSSINYQLSGSIVDIINNIDSFPGEYRDTILFNAGGVLNHELYFSNMSGQVKLPKGRLLDKINQTYGSYDVFKSKFIDSANKMMGSGYTFLVLDKDKNIDIVNLSNQDSPYSYGMVPLFTIDLWEHAYYLDYQNNRKEYIDKFFSIVDFTVSENIYESNI